MNEKNSIKMGRANDSDVRMTDISISRNHASLKLINGSFYLVDNHSKFGTLVQVQNSVSILPEKQISFQCGKVFLTCNLKRTLYAFLTCYKNMDMLNMDYNDNFSVQDLLIYKEEMEKVNFVEILFYNFRLIPSILSPCLTRFLQK
jgi:hypothetical protein